MNETVDAIVTAANESLLGGGGVDWAVHQAAGPRLVQAGTAIAPCDAGDAKAIPAFEFPGRNTFVCTHPGNLSIAGRAWINVAA